MDLPQVILNRDNPLLEREKFGDARYNIECQAKSNNLKLPALSIVRDSGDTMA